MTTPYQDDISAATASAAFSGTSWTPEKRGEYFRASYAEHLTKIRAWITAWAEKRGRTADEAAEMFERYRAAYRRRSVEYLSAAGRTYSAFIAGPSNYPARRMEKRFATVDARMQHLIDLPAQFTRLMRRTWGSENGSDPILSSDDDAIERIAAKVQKLGALQDAMKAANAAIRKHAKTGHKAQIAALVELGFHPSRAADLLSPDFAGRIGFAPYELSNNGANMRRLEQRIEQIARLRATPDNIYTLDDGTEIEIAPSENRVRVTFPRKLDSTDMLKRHGFRWSQTRGAWSGYYNANTLAYVKALETASPRSA